MEAKSVIYGKYHSLLHPICQAERMVNLLDVVENTEYLRIRLNYSLVTLICQEVVGVSVNRVS